MRAASLRAQPSGAIKRVATLTVKEASAMARSASSRVYSSVGMKSTSP